jgi:DNA-binding NarL/FixJ family response regulator
MAKPSNMAEGLTNKEIAIKIDLVEPTIKCHVSSILRKMKASARTQGGCNSNEMALLILKTLISPSLNRVRL